MTGRMSVFLGFFMAMAIGQPGSANAVSRISVQVEGDDARDLMARIPGESQAAGKAMLIGDEKMKLGIQCDSSGSVSVCSILVVSLKGELALGESFQATQLLSESIVSRVTLDREPSRGEWTLGWKAKSGKAEIECEQIYSPSDLPIYVGCTLLFR